jgi:hypothetical protein
MIIRSCVRMRKATSRFWPDQLVALKAEPSRQATRNTPAAEYQRIRDGAKLLTKVDPAVVRRHCKWCDRLFSALGAEVGVTI